VKPEFGRTIACRRLGRVSFATEIRVLASQFGKGYYLVNNAAEGP